MNPTEILVAGARELMPLLTRDGFAFVPTGSGPSSGGNYASGEFRRDDRRLELHFRYSLGLVAYHVGEIAIAHEDYVRAVQALDGIATKNRYPGFGQDAVGQFQALRADLEAFGARFLRGTPEEFRALRAWLDEHPRRAGLP